MYNNVVTKKTPIYGENTTIRHKVFLELAILREVQRQTIYCLSGYFKMNPFKIMQEPSFSLPLLFKLLRPTDTAESGEVFEGTGLLIAQV